MNVALYARVSSDKQDTDLSISAQLRALRDFATKHEHQVVKEYVDEAETGTTTARPAFREMIAAARSSSKPFQQVLIWKYSRFARSREDSILYKAMLKKAGVALVSINEPIDDSPTGRLMEAIIESLDEFYSDNLGEEVTRGMRESASRGFYLSGRTPYGYRKNRVNDNGKERIRLEPEPNQAVVVKGVFEAVLNGSGLLNIAKDLNSRAVPGPTGKGWSKTGLYGILTNEIYTGVSVWGKNSKRGFEPVRSENACTPLIDRGTFVSVQNLMKERSPKKQHPKRVASPFLLSGLAKCGHCGKALVGRYAKSGQFAYYACGTLDKKGSGACQGRYVNAGRLDKQVIEQIRDRILTKENLKELARMVDEETDIETKSFKNELDLVSESILNINHRLDHLYEAIETGKIGLDDLAVRIRELRTQQEQLQARRIVIEAQLSDRKVELADMASLSGSLNDLQVLLSEGTLTERRSFIRSFVKDVTVKDSKGVINYTMLPTSDNLAIEKDMVLSTVRDGGAEGIRTPDLLLAKEALSRLSYSPI